VGVHANPSMVRTERILSRGSGPGLSGHVDEGRTDTREAPAGALRTRRPNTVRDARVGAAMDIMRCESSRGTERERRKFECPHDFRVDRPTRVSTWLSDTAFTRVSVPLGASRKSYLGGADAVSRCPY